MDKLICRGCGEEKPVDDFSIDRRTKRGRQYRCRDCQTLAKRAWTKFNPEKVRWANIKSLYGVTQEQWEATFEAQGRVCAVCGTDEHGGVWWHTDHNHETGEFRGVTCHGCNVAIGLMKDDPERLIAAAAYLIVGSVAEVTVGGE